MCCNTLLYTGDSLLYLTITARHQFNTYLHHYSIQVVEWRIKKKQQQQQLKKMKITDLIMMARTLSRCPLVLF